MLDKLKELVLQVVPDKQACRKMAETLMAQHPGLSRLDLARVAIKKARNWGVATGAVTGIASSPLTMFPAALVDAASILKIEGMMAGVVAAILDPVGLENDESFRADVISVIFPAAASQALRQVAIKTGESATKNVIRKYVTEDFLKSAFRFAAEFIGVELTQKAVISRSVPIVGAGIGAAWNWLEVRAVGARAIRYHTKPDAPLKARRIKDVKVS